MEKATQIFNTLSSLVVMAAQGTWLFFLYLFIAYIMVGTLGSLQLRDGLDAIEKGATYDDVILYKKAFDTKVHFIENRNRRSNEHLYAEVNQMELTLADMWQEITEEALTRGIIPNIEGEGDPEQIYSEDLPMIEAHCGEKYGGEELCLKLQEYLELERKTIAKYSSIDQAITVDNMKHIDAVDEITELRNATKFSNLFSTVEFMDKHEFTEFLRQPREILVLQLTMVMGTLGSLVTMTWLFMRRESELGIRRSLFLPLVGSVSAVIIFVFFKAGQLTISSGGAETSLSPFFLSFVGIISGLLSERAYGRMESIGTRFFTVDDDHLRWGVRLKQALADSGLTIAQLAQYLDVEEATAKNLVNETIPATYSQQKIIAASLRLEVRQLFSDEPPADQRLKNENKSPFDDRPKTDK